MHEGWFASISEVRSRSASGSACVDATLASANPGPSGAGSSSSAAPPTVVGPTPAPKDPVAASDKDLNSVSKTKAILPTCMKILGNRTTYKLMVLMEAMSEPLLKAHQRTAVQLKTCMGNQEWIIGMASGVHDATYLKDMVHKVCSWDFWRSAGFTMDYKSAHDDMINTSPAMQEELMLADTVADMLCALLYGELQNCRHFRRGVLASLSGTAIRAVFRSTFGLAPVWCKCISGFSGTVQSAGPFLGLPADRYPPPI